ncbi:MAG: hypothetical protein HY644_14590 [Acidobacteria bacterium]|nr:hypothetical protein [Acidobacteriota bacterium]
MPQLLIIGTQGAENPTKGSLPFFLAKAAKESGRDVAVVLAADSSLLVNATMRENVKGVGFPLLSELYQFALDSKIPIYI